MGLFQTIKNWFTNPQKNAQIAKTMNVTFRMPEDITGLIAEWRDLYMGVDDGTKNCRKASGVASLIAKDLATWACNEMRITTETETAKDWDIFTKQLKLSIRQQVEYALAMGYVVCRPYVREDHIEYSWYSADRVLPTAWQDKQLTGCVLLDYYATADPVTDVKVIYTKLEAHGTDKDDGLYHIRTKLFKNYTYDTSSASYQGTEVPLETVPEWAGITPDIIIENPATTTFCYMGTPVANNKSLNVPVGVSLFKDCVAWIKEFDEAFESARWENKAGRSHIFVSESMIPSRRIKPVNGNNTILVDDLSALDRQIYKKLETETGNDLFEQWAPALRFENFTQYMNFLLHVICILAGLDPGQYVFDEKSYAVTATEIKSKNQRTYNTIQDIQTYMTTPLVDDLIATVRQLQQLYGMNAIPDNLEIAIDYGDSILVDETLERTFALQEVQQGVRSVRSYLIDVRKLTEEQADEEIKMIKADQPAIYTEGV